MSEAANNTTLHMKPMKFTVLKNLEILSKNEQTSVCYNRLHPGMLLGLIQYSRLVSECPSATNYTRALIKPMVHTTYTYWKSNRSDWVRGLRRVVAEPDRSPQ